MQRYLHLSYFPRKGVKTMSVFHDRDYRGFFCNHNGDVLFVSDSDVAACDGSISEAVRKYGRIRADVVPTKYHLSRLFA